MRAVLSRFVRVAAVTLVLMTPAYAATLHIAPTGNDANAGTLAAPLATPGRALQLAAAGDTILLRNGSYSIARTLAIAQTGLTLRSYPGEWARIVGGTTDETNLTSVIVVYAGNVTIENVELQGASYYGIKLDEYYGPQPNITIRGVYVHHTGRDGIKVQSADNLLIEHSEIAFSGVRDASNAEGIDVMGSIGARIRRNYVHDIATNGIFVKAGTRQAIVEANRVERTGYSGILLGSESGAEFMRDRALYEAIDCLALNNLIVDTGMAGLGSIAGDSVRFENNTVINAARNGQATFRTAPNSYNTAARNVTLRNNIFVLAPGSTRPMVQLFNYSGQISSDFNIWYSVDGRYQFWRESSTGASNWWTSLEQWRAGVNADWSSRTAAPLLDAADLYRPLDGSPAIDTGETLEEVLFDMSGTARPQGPAYDIGAHERPAGSDVTPPPPPPATVPSAPTGLTAKAGSRGSIALRWTDTSSDEQGFRVERALSGGSFAIVATLPAGASAYNDTGTKMNRTYTYRVVAFNGAGASGYSNSAVATTTR